MCGNVVVWVGVRAKRLVGTGKLIHCMKLVWREVRILAQRPPPKVGPFYFCFNNHTCADNLLPDACAATEVNGKIETMVYDKILQMKQDRIIPVFRCQVIKTMVTQYCNHRSSTGVTWYCTSASGNLSC
jgi:hypothetical protein